MTRIEKKKSFNTKNVLKGFWNTLSKRRKLQLGAVFFTMILSALSEALSLAAFIPFLTLITDPDKLFKMTFLKELVLSFNITEINELRLFVVVIFIIAVLLAAVLRIFNLWISGRIAALIGSDMSVQVYVKNLYQPYLVQVNKNSSKVISSTTQELRYVIQCINLSLIGLTNGLIAISIISTLFIVDKFLAVIAFLTFAVFYSLIALNVRKRLYINSKKTNEAYQKQINIIQEGLGGIRDLILSGSQSIYANMYKKVDKPMRFYQHQSNFFSAFPRYALEALILIMLAIFSYSLVRKDSSDINLIPSLGALALGAQRLLPSIQLVYANWANVKANIFNLENVLNQINQKIPKDYINNPKKFSFKEKIVLKNISFKYDDKFILKDFNLTIRKGETFGITGKTGSGKTTLVDLIIGLLVPSGGDLEIDDISLYSPKNYKYISSWRKSVAHVPQSIFLADKSFAENIAFGHTYLDHDLDQIIKVAKLSQIHDYIESTKYGYQTIVGERGVKLSGGQKQRIGIARALYRNPDILVLDEATSALDFETEKEVMNSINKISNNRTVIMIAHRLSTLENCDKTILIREGSIDQKYNL